MTDRPKSIGEAFRIIIQQQGKIAKLERKLENRERNLDIEIKANRHYHQQLIELDVVIHSYERKLHALGVKT